MLRILPQLNTAKYDYYMLYKPYGYVSQFSPMEDKKTLSDLDYKFPKNVYPVGRLDEDSEGLLLLTNDAALNHRLLNPNNKMPKTYWAQVEGLITTQAIECLRQGVEIKAKDRLYTTLPAVAKTIAEPERLPVRHPPIRYRANIPTSWVEIIISEGKNRQVRKMTAKVGFPTLRLIRYAIGDFTLPSLTPGKVWKL